MRTKTFVTFDKASSKQKKEEVLKRCITFNLHKRFVPNSTGNKRLFLSQRQMCKFFIGQ
jgi:hypothetical protein